MVFQSYALYNECPAERHSGLEESTDLLDDEINGWCGNRRDAGISPLLDRKPISRAGNSSSASHWPRHRMTLRCS